MMSHDDLDDVFGSGPRCPKCGADLVPEPMATGKRIVVAYACPEHGPIEVADPFA